MRPLASAASLLYRSLRQLVPLDITWLMFLERKQVDQNGTWPAAGSISSRLLTPRDVESRAGNAEYDLSAELADRLRSGLDHCVGVFVDNELASYAWFALESIEAEHNRGGHPKTGVDFCFPSHMAFMYKGFTVPRYRGRGLYKTVTRSAFELLADGGVTTIISTADWSNAAALASCTRLGFLPIGRVCVLGVANLVWRRRPPAALQMGIRGGVSRRT